LAEHTVVKYPYWL